MRKVTLVFKYRGDDGNTRRVKRSFVFKRRGSQKNAVQSGPGTSRGAGCAANRANVAV
jgi:hypothetical protein